VDGTDLCLAPNDGPLVDLGGLGVHFKVRGEQTGGQFAVVEHPVEPSVVVEPHRHQHEDELSYVLDGTVWARVGDREVEAAAGSYVWKPRGGCSTASGTPVPSPLGSWR
jgi:quercetin dioxygenase-like cupin family protein